MVLAYALPAFALAIIGIPVYVYIPKFYTDVVGVPVAIAGLIVGLVRVTDAFTDPLMGVLSDRTRSRMGRRRPYLVWGVLPLAVALWALFCPPAGLTSGASIAWLATWLFLLFLAWTVVAIPYESLGAELSERYDERTVLLGTRDGFLIAGTLTAAIVPAVIGAVLGDGSEGAERARFFWLSVLYVPLLIGSAWTCAALVPERVATPASATDLRADARAMLKNRAFLVLLVSYTIGAFGSNLPATLILYYVEQVLGSGRAELFLLLYFVTGVVFLPAWIALARRWSKRNAWLVAMALNIGAFAGVYFLGRGDEWGYGILVTLSGVGFGATLALPSSMQADTIDYHELLTGSRREGCYIGVWSVFRKLAAALGVGVALFLLGRSGYEPGAEQPEEVIRMLRMLYAVVPCACNAVALLVALFYPIDRTVHAQIQQAIAQGRITKPSAP
jgi:GPH family glycoside/pentoside/hexuronide:cation symporter